ncbi:MAG: DUF4157 domain-containing protein [Anaerolineaceae bacterium]|nr:DUF4157 domain-containing protein [Anaerolineaceae bacterium]
MHEHEIDETKSARRSNISKNKQNAAPLKSAVSPFQRSLIQLQRMFGNRHVQRLMASNETDQDSGSGSAVENAIKQERGQGQRLDNQVRTQMEPSLGANFGNVNVHTDAKADTLSRSLNARAFTSGQDVFFRQGAFNPGSSSGRELIAHELTHVVQQNGDKVQNKLSVNRPGDKYEQEADRVAAAVIQNEGQAAPSRTGAANMQRQDDEEEPQTKLESGVLQPQAEEDEETQTKLESDSIQRQDEDEDAA